MKGLEIYLTLIFVIITLDLFFVEGEFTCFRKHRAKRNKEFCKGPLRNKKRFSTPETCCAKKGKGFAVAMVKYGKGRNKYRCTPCSSLTKTEVVTKPSTTERPDWGSWNPCSTTCGAGWRNRYRKCDDCDKNHFDNVQSEPCMVNFYCPIDGNWGPWFSWSSCTAECGGGTRKRHRRCNYPPPTHGGKNCPGHGKKEETCNEEPCPVDGAWGPWSRYSVCSATCGSGIMSRTRKCDNPTTQFGGKDCRGSSYHERRCKNKACPLHGGWSLWGSWSECSVTCDTGVLTRTRTCDSPRPLFGGRQCEGPSEDTRECINNKKCPVHGQWSRWSTNGRCIGPRCQKGYHLRSRSCTNPRPRHGGRPCVGRSYDKLPCVNDENCPTRGNWCPWNEWSQCTATCTGLNSMQVRQRSCMCPKPKSGGSQCEGETYEVRECDNVPSCNPYGDFVSNRKKENSNSDALYSNNVNETTISSREDPTVLKQS